MLNMKKIGNNEYFRMLVVVKSDEKNTINIKELFDN